MARINTASLRARLDNCRGRFDDIQRKGEAGADLLSRIDALFLLFDILVAVFLEKTTQKTSCNSSLPSSRNGAEDGTHTASRPGSRSKGPKVRQAESDNLRTATECRQCGHDLTGTACSGHEKRVKVDIVLGTVERRITAEIKDCPRCHTRTKGGFPDAMQDPLQYGPGIVACAVYLLSAQMIPLRRIAAMLQSMTGRLLSEATLLDLVSRLHQAQETREAAATERLRAMPVMHVDETSLRVEGKDHWIHVCSGGPVTLKRVHRKRGCEAIGDIGIIPRFGGVIVHDCWRAYLAESTCKHKLRGAHLLRELQVVIDSNDYP